MFWYNKIQIGDYMNKVIFKISFSSICIALGIILPFLTGQIPEIGSMLLPMHIPVLICGFICGWKYGLLVGLITPLLRSVSFGMPPIYPTAIAMSFELAAYGFISGLLFKIVNKKLNFILSVYSTLILALIIGRIVWGFVRFGIGMIDKTNIFSFELFLSGAVISCWPGIIIQLFIIPILLLTLKKLNLLKNI